MENLKILTLLGLWLISCKPAEPIVLDYCAMLEADQSYVNSRDETNEAIRAENNRKRDELFVDNFSNLISLIKQQGFPDISRIHSSEDSCRVYAVRMTLIHIAQAKPETFFSEETVSLFKKELDRGNVDTRFLASPFRTSFLTNKFCSELREPIAKAIVTLEVGPKIFREPRFVDCN